MHINPCAGVLGRGKRGNSMELVGNWCGNWVGSGSLQSNIIHFYKNHYIDTYHNLGITLDSSSSSLYCSNVLIKLLIPVTSPPSSSYLKHPKTYNLLRSAELHHLPPILIPQVLSQMVDHIGVLSLRVVVVEGVALGHVTVVVMDGVDVELIV